MHQIPHMRTGHAYSRALHAHILSAAAVTSLKHLAVLLDSIFRILELPNQLCLMVTWLHIVKYLIQVYIIRLFIFTERTGDWELHLYCIFKMIPLFHVAGHFSVAKAV